MDELTCCKVLHETRLKDWTISGNKNCLVEFINVNAPLRMDIVRIKKNGETYGYKHLVRYYRDSWPRYLDRKEHLLNEESGFESIVQVFDALEEPPYKPFETMRFTFEKNE